LIHEFAHYISGASDNTREFENILTDMLGFAMNDIQITHNNEPSANITLYKRLKHLFNK
jgi:hypothetical protein